MTIAGEALSATLFVEGMDWRQLCNHVEKAARHVAGVADCSVSLATGRAAVDFDPPDHCRRSSPSAITDAGYPASPAGVDAIVDEKHTAEKPGMSTTWLSAPSSDLPVAARGVDPLDRSLTDRTGTLA